MPFARRLALLVLVGLLAACSALPPRGEVPPSRTYPASELADTALARVAASSRPPGETAPSGSLLLPTTSTATMPVVRCWVTFMNHREANFIDTDVPSTGRVVSDLAVAFERDWNSELAWPVQTVLGRPADAEAAQRQFDRAVDDAHVTAPPFSIHPRRPVTRR